MIQISVSTWRNHYKKHGTVSNNLAVTKCIILTLTCTEYMSELERVKLMWPGNLFGFLQAWLILSWQLLSCNNLSVWWAEEWMMSSNCCFFMEMWPARRYWPFCVILGQQRCMLEAFIGRLPEQVTSAVGGERRLKDRERWIGCDHIWCIHILQVTSLTNTVSLKK